MGQARDVLMSHIGGGDTWAASSPTGTFPIGATIHNFSACLAEVYSSDSTFNVVFTSSTFRAFPNTWWLDAKPLGAFQGWLTQHRSGISCHAYTLNCIRISCMRSKCSYVRPQVL